MYYLLIGGMTYLSHQYGFPIVSILVCMVTHWTKTMVSHNVGYWIVMNLPDYYTIWALNLERIDDLKVVIYSSWIPHY